MKPLTTIIAFTYAITFSVYGSVTAVEAEWSRSDAAAATEWLNGINSSPTRQNTDFGYFSTTSGAPPFPDQFTSNLTVWENLALLDFENKMVPAVSAFVE